MFTVGSSSRRGSARRRLVCLVGIASLWLAAAATARADDAVCPGASDACPYGRAIVVGEGGHGVFRLAQALAVSPDGRRGYVGGGLGFRVQAVTPGGRGVYAATVWVSRPRASAPAGVFTQNGAGSAPGPGEIRAVGG